MMRKQTYDIVGELIQAIDSTFTANSIVDNGLFNYTLPSCNTLWLSVGDIVTIGGNDYQITVIIPNVSITVQGTIVLTVKTFVVELPVYRHGTIITTNTEIKKDNDDGISITPLIYLREGNGFLKDRMLNRDSPNDRESDLEIYFLKKNDFSKTEDDIIEFGVIPMRNLLYAFIDVLNKRTDLVGIFDDYTAEDWLRFGFQASDGTKSKYFNVCDMTSCKLNITLNFNKKIACCTN